jgi:hypothetical protein
MVDVLDDWQSRSNAAAGMLCRSEAGDRRKQSSVANWSMSVFALVEVTAELWSRNTPVVLFSKRRDVALRKWRDLLAGRLLLAREKPTPVRIGLTPPTEKSLEAHFTRVSDQMPRERAGHMAAFLRSSLTQILQLQKRGFPHASTSSRSQRAEL